MRVLLVKMSSLGDVVHALPAVTDAARQGVVFDWVVEEAFAAIPALHPAVREVWPIAWRRWRKNLRAEGPELGAFVQRLRGKRYDLILDAQGLLKSAAVTLAARGGSRAGLSFTAAREPLAAFAYGNRAAVPKGGHAIDRLRALFAASLGYKLPTDAPSFGLSPGASATSTRTAVLLHGTTWESKHWPETMWRALAEALRADGWRLLLPSGNDQERARAERLAAEPAEVLPAMSLDGLIGQLAEARLVVGVDSGLSHLAGALDIPTVVLYGSTSARLTGVRGTRVQSLASDFACAPCLARRCRYSGPPEHWQDEPVEPPCYARLAPDRVFESARKLVERIA
ncbi:MAG: lipopolysaccharide heptosyltransferase I [Pseudomonadota bacterium]